MTRSRPHVLVVDPSGLLRDVVKDMLEASGYRVHVAEDGETMRRLIDLNRFDLVVLDVVLPGEPSEQLAYLVEGLGVPLVMISGSDRVMQSFWDRDMQLLHKPFGMKKLLQAVETALASGQAGQRASDPKADLV